MKRIAILMLALLMVFAMCACGGKNTDPTQGNSTGAWPNGDITIYSGYSVGSLSDINIRTIADWIMRETGVTVNIETNDVGGGANLAAKLATAKPDGQTMMLMAVNCISNYHNGIWQVNPADATKFKPACGALQPLPSTGCMILTQADAPYSTWQELADYAAANPGVVTVASIPGKVMDIKMKAIFNGTGVSQNVRWVSTKSADAAAGLLGGNINCIIVDEITAVGYLKDGGVKAIINCRADNDLSYYEDGEEKDIISTVPTLLDVFGDKASDYMVQTRCMFMVPAGTPDEICQQIEAIVGKLDQETEGEWYERCRANGGTSKYYTWSGNELMDDWAKLDPVIEKIVKMG